MWFRFEGLSERDCEELAGRVVRLFPQVNAWLREKVVGPNVSAIAP